jgi:hypothetical protein
MGKKYSHRQKKSTKRREGVISSHSGLEKQLRALSLRLKDVTGDGNCLFRALADQLLGDIDQHTRMRSEVCHFLAAHEDEFQYFVSEDDHRQHKDMTPFQRHIALMRESGTYGGNMELVAFSRLFQVSIWIHQEGRPIFQIHPEDGKPAKRALHLAYHSFEHYSSIRMLDGPDAGVPDIRIQVSGVRSDDEEMEAEQFDKEEQVVRATGESDLNVVRQTLATCQGNVDEAVEKLIEQRNKTLEAQSEDQEEDHNDEQVIEENCRVSADEKPEEKRLAEETALPKDELKYTTQQQKKHSKMSKQELKRLKKKARKERKKGNTPVAQQTHPDADDVAKRIQTLTI